MSELTPGFIVAHSHRLEELTDLVVRLTGTYPLPPLVNETLLVQSNGISQWLKIHLAEAAGIAAMLDVTLPARFQWQAYRSVLGNDLPKTSPFDKDRLTWRILRILPALLTSHQDTFEGLARYLGTSDSEEPRKWYQLCERLADLFDQYQMYRADWLADWADGGQLQVDDDNRWQPILWRALLEDVGAAQWNNRAQLHQTFIQAARLLTPSTRPAGLPPRVIVFGISSLPQQVLELLDALKGCMQIVLCVHNPCRYHWADIIDGHELMRLEQRRHAFKPGMQANMDDDTLHSQSNPLLAAWGKQGRDYIRLLDQFDETRIKSESLRELSFELFDSAPPQSLLQELQDDILELRSASERLALGSNIDVQDQSLQFHSAHSPQREVEVLHDQLLAAFEKNPALRPRDIMVMVPDVDRYAPHINAVFGKLDRKDPRYIPYTLADQGLRHQQPILIALEYLVSIRQQRLTASALLDILQVPAVQQRFQMQPEWLPLLQRWIDGASIRWAIHGEHRETLGLPSDTGRNSWWFGLRRMLLGYAVGEAEVLSSASIWSETEPYAEVAGLEAQAAGALAELLHTIEKYFDASAGLHSTSAWQALLSDFIDAIFAPESDADIALVAQVHEQLGAWAEAAAAADYSLPVPLPVVIESWLGRLDQSSLQQRFLAGSVNFATLMPMRAIPFQWVCLLGMNDGDYPRSQKPFDFDLMARDYRPGDRSRRDDDRYLFLEALLSARTQLYISWCGRSIRDNSERPPSVLVSQLLEHVTQCWPNLQSSCRIQQHALQPFSWQYFERAEPAYGVPFTYAHEWRVVHDPAATAPATGGLAQWQYDSPFTTRHLATALEQPAKLLFNLRFEVYFSDREAAVEDDERFALDGLSTYQLHEPLLELLTDTLMEDPDAHWEMRLAQRIQRYVRAGELPAGAAGASMAAHFKQLLRPSAERLGELVQSYSEVLPMQPLRAVTEISGRPVVVESVARRLRVNRAGERVSIRVKASKLVDQKGNGRAQHALLAWIEHVLLNQLAPTTTVVIGQVGMLKLQPLTPAVAHDYMQLLLTHAHTCLQQPIGLDFETIYFGWSQQYKKLEELVQQQQPEIAHDKAAKVYEDSGQFASARVERAPYTGRLFPTYAALIADDAITQVAPALYLPMLKALVNPEDVA